MKEERNTVRKKIEERTLKNMMEGERERGWYEGGGKVEEEIGFGWKDITSLVCIRV